MATTSAGVLLRRARVRAGLTQQELAERAGVAQSVISVYESGQRQPSVPLVSPFPVRGYGPQTASMEH